MDECHSKEAGPPASLKTYRQLRVWQRAMDLVEAAYDLTAQFPSHERYGLASQLQRAAVSVPANIAEGYGRDYPREYLQYLSVASGSLMEVETHLAIVVRIKLVSRDKVLPIWNLPQDVGRMLTKLKSSLRKSTRPIPKP